MSNTASPLTLSVWGCSHHTTPLEVREQLGLTSQQQDLLYEMLLHVEGIHEFMVLATCNRTEIFYVHDLQTESWNPAEWIAEIHPAGYKIWQQYSRTLRDREAIEHLFSICAGLDSQLLGETEILGQVKNAYQDATKRGTVGSFLHRILQKSFQAAKHIRTHSDIGKGTVSIGNLTVDLARRIFGDLKSCRILVIGAGEVAEKTLQALRGNGAGQLTITNRTLANAEALARQFNGLVLPFENLYRQLTEQDIVICSATVSAPLILKQHLLERPVKSRSGLNPLFLIDLALPRNVEPSVGKLEDVFLYNLDDLAEMSANNMKTRTAGVDECLAIVQQRAQHLWDWLHNPKPSVPSTIRKPSF